MRAFPRGLVPCSFCTFDRREHIFFQNGKKMREEENANREVEKRTASSIQFVLTNDPSPLFGCPENDFWFAF
jgi:hypothetical protein